MTAWCTRAAVAVLAVVMVAVSVDAQQRRGRGAGRQGADGRPRASESQNMRTMVDGQVRTAHFYAGDSRNRAVPLVFVFHGHGQNGDIGNRLFEIENAWPEAFVIYPDGIPGVPDDNDTKAAEPGWQKDPNTVNNRDLKFFDEMYSLITSSYMIDRSRVYSVGFSNGGRMTYLLWSQRHDKLTAVAAFSSQALTADLHRTMSPLPAMVGHGLTDPQIVYREAGASFAKIVEVNRNAVDTNGRTGRDLGIFRYPAAAGGAETVQWTHGGGHAPPPRPGQEIVTFFKRHHR